MELRMTEGQLKTKLKGVYLTSGFGLCYSLQVPMYTLMLQPLTIQLYQEEPEYPHLIYIYTQS